MPGGPHRVDQVPGGVPQPRQEELRGPAGVQGEGGFLVSSYNNVLKCWTVKFLFLLCVSGQLLFFLQTLFEFSCSLTHGLLLFFLHFRNQIPTTLQLYSFQ